jgi:hypothetical protein
VREIEQINIVLDEINWNDSFYQLPGHGKHVDIRLYALSRFIGSSVSFQCWADKGPGQMPVREHMLKSVIYFPPID